MEIAQIYVSYDLGLNYSVTQCEISGNYGVQNEINPFIYRRFADITANFYGNDYDSIVTQLNNGIIWLSFKLYISGSEFVIGKMLIRSKLDASRKIITIDTFTIEDDYTLILQSLQKKIFLKDAWGTGRTIILQTSAERPYNIPVEVPNTVNFADYKLLYNPDGSAYDSVSTFGWGFFTLESTEVLPNTNLLYNAFTYESPLYRAGNGYTKIVWLGSFKWVQLISVPIICNVTQTTDCLPLIDVINYLLNNNSLSLVSQNYFDFEKYTLTGLNRLNVDDELRKFDDVEISLSDIFKTLETLFQIHWYIDGTTLKYKHISELAYITELFDLRTYYIYNANSGKNQIEYKDAEKPIFERWSSNDGETMGFRPLVISYDNDTETVQEFSIPITTDLQNAWNNFSSGSNNMILLSDYVSGLDRIITYQLVDYGQGYKIVYNYECSFPYIFELYLKNYRPFDSGLASFDNTVYPFNALRRQITYTQTFDTFLSGFESSDISEKFITTDMGSGKIRAITTDVKSGKSTYQLDFYEEIPV